jgi:HSP20 family protein
MTAKRKEMTEAVPRRELDVFSDMDRMFDTLFRHGWLRPFRELWPEWSPFGERMEFPEFAVPHMDLIERDEEVLVRAELPGVEKKDLKLDLSDDLLTIRGERRREEKHEQGEVYRAEIARGAFSRTIRLPQTVDFEKADAKFKDGMLEVHLPKTRKTQRRRIQVK